MRNNPRLSISRRRFLASAAALSILAFHSSAMARSISGRLPWEPLAGAPPTPVDPLGWKFFTLEEAATIEAIVERFIPADDLSPGGKEAGCAVFIDRQLAGSYGEADRLYMQGPFRPGLPTQGYQGSLTPAGRYREGLKALNAYVRAHEGNKNFVQLSGEEQDKVLKGMEKGEIDLKLAGGLDTRAFFELVLQNTMEGFFADPVYGGNRDMVSWKMLGFPGARYDYRDFIDKHNQPYPLGPVGIVSGAADWTPKG
jgi:gluconate 2-dehydrogenase gamma chain